MSSQRGASRRARSLRYVVAAVATVGLVAPAVASAHESGGRAGRRRGRPVARARGRGGQEHPRPRRLLRRSQRSAAAPTPPSAADRERLGAFGEPFAEPDDRRRKRPTRSASPTRTATSTASPRRARSTSCPTGASSTGTRSRARRTTSFSIVAEGGTTFTNDQTRVLDLRRPRSWQRPDARRRRRQHRTVPRRAERPADPGAAVARDLQRRRAVRLAPDLPRATGASSSRAARTTPATRRVAGHAASASSSWAG